MRDSAHFRPRLCGKSVARARSVESVQVRSPKLGGRRYTMTVVRERGPELAPRQGPGYDEFLPHDAVHLVVEAEAGLAGGAYGRIAAGQSNIFWPADPAQRRRQSRREARRTPTRAEHEDMDRSERLASVAPLLWEIRKGRRTELPPWARGVAPVPAVDAVLERILDRLDAFAAQWSALPDGGSVTLDWPDRLVSPVRR
jgi:hypothetical protein